MSETLQRRTSSMPGLFSLSWKRRQIQKLYRARKYFNTFRTRFYTSYRKEPTLKKFRRTIKCIPETGRTTTQTVFSMQYWVQRFHKSVSLWSYLSTKGSTMAVQTSQSLVLSGKVFREWTQTQIFQSLEEFLDPVEQRCERCRLYLIIQMQSYNPFDHNFVPERTWLRWSLTLSWRESFSLLLQFLGNWTEFIEEITV